MPTKYQDFGELYKKYSMYNQGLEEAQASTGIPYNIRKLAKSLAVDDSTYTLFDTTDNQKTIITGLEKGVKYHKRDVNSFANDNLEDILGSAPAELVDFSLNVIKLKDVYTGDKAQTYTKIAQLHKDIREMGEIFYKKDVKKMQAKALEQYKSEHNTNSQKDKDALELIEALLDIDGELALIKYNEMFKELQKKHDNKLQGNKLGYLAANLKDEDFVDFYEGVVAMMNQQAQQAQAKAQQGNRR